MKLKVMKTLMSRHNSEVATSALYKKMSRHHFDVATTNQGCWKSNMLQLERKRSRLMLDQKTYTQIYDTITKGLLSNPRQRRQKLVKVTIQMMYM